MSEQKKKKTLSSLHEDIKEIRQRKPLASQIEELNKVLDQQKQKEKKKIANPPEIES
jgi:hypothetical protein